MGAFLKNRWNYSAAFLICQHQNLQSNFIYFRLNQKQISRSPDAQKNPPSFIRTSVLCLFSSHTAIVLGKRKNRRKITGPFQSLSSSCSHQMFMAWGATFVCFTQKQLTASARQPLPSGHPHLLSCAQNPAGTWEHPGNRQHHQSVPSSGRRTAHECRERAWNSI